MLSVGNQFIIDSAVLYLNYAGMLTFVPANQNKNFIT